MKRDIRLPPVFRGMRIGLLGGSFNPPHAAHRALSLLALKRLGLDRVWWLVTPGNPLKDNRRLPPLDKRLAAARALAAHPAIDVTAVEVALDTRYTYDTVLALRRRFPGVHFVFIMGADNLAQLNRWRRWRELANLVPIAVVDRPELGIDQDGELQTVPLPGGPLVLGQDQVAVVGKTVDHFSFATTA